MLVLKVVQNNHGNKKDKDNLTKLHTTFGVHIMYIFHDFHHSLLTHNFHYIYLIVM